MKLASKKLVAAVAVGVVAIGAVGVMPTMASNNPTVHKIVKMLGIDKDLASYESIIGKSVTQDGITMTINEVIVDNDQLIVAVTTTSDESLVGKYAGPGGFLNINGKEINKGMYVLSSELVDDYTGQAVLVFPTDEQLDGELDIKLQLNSPLMGVERSPHWDYEFTATGEALKAETAVFELNHNVELENGIVLKLEKYSANPFADRIYFEETVREGEEAVVFEEPSFEDVAVAEGEEATVVQGSEEANPMFTIEGTDQDGNAVKFGWRMMRDNKGEFIAQDEYINVVQDATELTLSVYADGEVVGESFTIKK